MANNVIDWAYQFDIYFVEKYLLVTIGDDADKYGVSRYLGSLKTIGKQCNLSARQVRRSLRRLEAWGLIKTYPQARPNGSDTVHVFQCRILIDPKTWIQPDTAPPAKRVRAARPSQPHTSTIMSTWVKDFEKAVQAKLDKHIFSTWFTPCEVVSIIKGRLTIKVPKVAHADILQDNEAVILEAAVEVSPEITKIHFQIPPDKK